jgi:hypothetical protein
MICQTCHGTGWLGETRFVRDTMSYHVTPSAPCPNPDCHAGQVSCCEATDDPEASPQEGGDDERSSNRH